MNARTRIYSLRAGFSACSLCLKKLFPFFFFFFRSSFLFIYYLSSIIYLPAVYWFALSMVFSLFTSLCSRPTSPQTHHPANPHTHASYPRQHPRLFTSPEPSLLNPTALALYPPVSTPVVAVPTFGNCIAACLVLADIPASFLSSMSITLDVIEHVSPSSYMTSNFGF